MSSKKTPLASKKKSPSSAGLKDFDSLVSSIINIQQQTQAFATKAVNVSLTLRNWLIGRQIELYERHGADRATYGDMLMDSLATHLQKKGWERCDRRELYRFRQFFITYPNIVETASPQLQPPADMRSLMALLQQSSIAMRESASPEPNMSN